MQILTISIDGRTRADLVQALAEVMANLTSGIDTANFQNEQMSLSYAIKEYQLPLGPGAFAAQPRFEQEADDEGPNADGLDETPLTREEKIQSYLSRGLDPPPYLYE